MYITKVEQGKGKRYRVYSEDCFLFALYSKELKQYHIAENIDLDDETICSIQQNLVFPHAKERSLYLLESRPYSTAMMRKKLRSNDYPPVVVDAVIDFLITYHYLDDMEYIRMYTEAYSSRKSKRQIKYELLGKGIEKNLIDTFFLNFDYSEKEAFEPLFQRYIRGKDLEDHIVRQKIYRYFYAKGYPGSLIEETLRQYVSE